MPNTASRLAVAPMPSMDRYERELALIESSYTRYLGAANAWRLSEPGFLDHFLRMLVSKLRVVFENAAGDIEMWSRSTAAQMESQLRDRRRGFKRRREALERIQGAAGDLERRITEVQAQDERLSQRLLKVDALADALRQLAAAPPSLHESAERAPHSVAGARQAGVARQPGRGRGRHRLTPQRRAQRSIPVTCRIARRLGGRAW